jgi:hypothetical protein
VGIVLSVPWCMLLLINCNPCFTCYGQLMEWKEQFWGVAEVVVWWWERMLVRRCWKNRCVLWIGQYLTGGSIRKCNFWVLSIFSNGLVHVVQLGSSY